LAQVFSARHTRARTETDKTRLLTEPLIIRIAESEAQS